MMIMLKCLAFSLVLTYFGIANALICFNCYAQVGRNTSCQLNPNLFNTPYGNCSLANNSCMTLVAKNVVQRRCAQEMECRIAMNQSNFIKCTTCHVDYCNSLPLTGNMTSPGGGAYTNFAPISSFALVVLMLVLSVL